jgi:hypothetical protein
MRRRCGPCHNHCVTVHEATQRQYAIDSIFARLEKLEMKDVKETVRFVIYYWANFARSVEPLWQLVASVNSANKIVVALKDRIEADERKFQRRILQICKKKGLHQSQ